MTDSEPFSEHDALSALLTPDGRILAELMADSAVSLADIAERLGVSDRRVRAVMTRLVASGMAVRTRVGRHYRYEPVRQMTLVHRDSARLLMIAGAILEQLPAVDRAITDETAP